MIFLVWAVPGHAAFYVEEDSPQQNALQVSAANAPQTYSIPFFTRKGQLGTRGKQALQSLLTDARNADTITVIGHGDGNTANTTFTTLGDQRALAIKQWLVRNGIPNHKIEMRDDMNGDPAGIPSYFNSEVQLAKARLPADRFQSAVLVRNTRDTQNNESRQGSISNANFSNTTLQTDSSKLVMVSKIIALTQSDLIRPEDAVTLITKLFSNRLDSAPQTTQVAHEAPVTPLIHQLALQPPLQSVADQVRTWTLDANKTLRTNLADWMTQIGWTMSDWQPVNPYQITFSSTLQGTLLDVLGEVAKAVPELDIQVSHVKREIRIIGQRS